MLKQHYGFPGSYLASEDLQEQFPIQKWGFEKVGI